MPPKTKAPGYVRVVSLPVVDVFTAGGDRLRVLDAFRPGWRLATDLANWGQRQLALRDHLRMPGEEKYPPYNRGAVFGTVARTANRKGKNGKPDAKVGDPQESSLYNLWTREYPHREAWHESTVVARDVLKAVEDAWKGHPKFGRYAVMFKGESRPMVFRFPYPWPVASQNLKVMRGKFERDNEWGDGPRVVTTGGCALANIPMPLPAGRVTLRLTGRGEFRRQLQQFDRLLAEPQRILQAKVTGRWAGGRLVGADLRIAARFDASEKAEGVTATLTTRPDALLQVEVEGDDREPWVLNCDHLRPLITAHDRWRFRFSQDLKHEKRWPADKRERTTGGSHVKSRCDRMNDRLKSERQQITACVAGYLRRRGVGTLVYDDSERSFLPRWGWAAMREVMSSKCEEFGISFQTVAGADDGDK